MSTQHSSLEHRLTRIERRQRMLGAAGLVFAAVILAAAALSPSADESVVRARRFQLVDEAGHVWIDIRHDSAETGIFVHDAAGDTRVGVAQFAHGGGGFALHGPEMKGAAVLYLRGQGSLTFYDGAGAVTARVP